MNPNMRFGHFTKDDVFHEIKPTSPISPAWEQCIFCESKFDLNSLHPSHVKYFGSHPCLCRRCGLCFGSYAKIWSLNIKDRILKAKSSAGEARTCFMCKKQYNLLGSFYRHMWYKNTEYPDFQMPDTNPEWGYWINAEGIDFLYPNLYTEICPECFQRLFWQNISIDPETQISAVRELGEKIGKLPVRNFPSYIYTYQDRDNIEWFLSLLYKLPDPELINRRFGSYFKLLLKSGLLPDGARRMRLGTWVLAKDGDLCFSLAERAIDDWLYKNKIPHKKEVRYPNSDMRCDWEVYKNEDRIFIEYFGLMNNKTYAAKADLKQKLAKEHDIKLIPILPNDDWETVLSFLVH